MSAWKVLGACVSGTRHTHAAQRCEDALGYHVRDDVLIISVADGAGSAPRAAEASACATRVALSSIQRRLAGGRPDAVRGWRELMDRVMEDARRALERRAQDETQLPDLATTLLVATVTPEWFVAAQIGDGAIVVASDSGLEAITLPDVGEYINETFFLTSSNFRDRTQRVVRPRPEGLHGIALITDGLQQLALELPAQVPHWGFFTPLFDFAASPDASEGELAAFLNSDAVCALTDDDKTLALAVPG